jgi:hypothetical protein
MAVPIVLYSANSWLAYAIAERYFNGEHHVWCTPAFDARSPYARDWHVPPTSSPFEIYKSLAEEVRRGDRHSAKIAQNRIGIARGANVRRGAGLITEVEEKEIASIVDAAETADFRPLIYVIPYHLVAAEIKAVAVADRAHPLSAEYLLERLPRTSFDVIEVT